MSVKNASRFNYDRLDISDPVKSYLSTICGASTFLAIVRMRPQYILSDFAYGCAVKYSGKTTDEIIESSKEKIRSDLGTLLESEHPFDVLFDKVAKSDYLIQDYSTISTVIARVNFLFGANEDQISSIIPSRERMFYERRNPVLQSINEAIIDCYHDFYDNSESVFAGLVEVMKLFSEYLPPSQAKMVSFYINSDYDCFLLNGSAAKTGFQFYEGREKFCWLDHTDWTNLSLAITNLSMRRSELKKLSCITAFEQYEKIESLKKRCIERSGVKWAWLEK